MEIAWRFDRFVILGTQVMGGETLAGHIQERMQSYVETTRKLSNGKSSAKKTTFSSCWLTELCRIAPWLVTEHEEKILGHPVKWARPGKLWTIEERKQLCSNIAQVWEDLFSTSRAIAELES